MKCWIGRHGYAGPESDDPRKERERPLTAEGRAMAKAIAGAMSDAGEIPNVIFCSPYQRAKDTADIYGGTFGVRVSDLDDLGPDRPLEDRIIELMGHGEVKRMMIVGHVDNTTPSLNNMGGDQKWSDLVMAEVRRVKIDRKTGAWMLKWGVKPSDLGLNDWVDGTTKA